MNRLIVYGSFAVVILLLYAIKKLFLDKIKNQVLRYILAMAVSYAVLILFNIIGLENEAIRIAFQKTTLRIGFGKVEPGMVMVVVPALYSIFFIGYFKKGLSAEERWKVSKRVMLSVFVNGILSFVLLMLFYRSYYFGYSLSKQWALIKASCEHIDWRFLPPFVGLTVLFVYIMKREHFKQDKKD
ncbi:hypothetical protein [Treponema pedis]|uniref:hypothetical protein n=1 Tax=Treponema pedis TaxID=409322 RepID=UPI00041E0FAC|nr:hypothetical protein [Treponema pedis]